jgi:hypothetical protein
LEAAGPMFASSVFSSRIGFSQGNHPTICLRRARALCDGQGADAGGEEQ